MLCTMVVGRGWILPRALCAKKKKDVFACVGAAGTFVANKMPFAYDRIFV